MPTVKIREASLSDSAVIAQLTATLGYFGDANVTRLRLEKIFDERDHLVLVAEREGVVVGWLQAHASTALESGFRVEIVGLVVSPECRRRGVGRNLVLRAVEWARRIAAAAVVVRSNVVRTESHQFYPALGFAASKTQSVYRLELPNSPGGR